MTPCYHRPDSPRHEAAIMLRSLVLSAALLLPILQPIVAFGQSETDVDQRAAYCLRVMEHEMVAAQQALSQVPASAPEVRASVQQVAEASGSRFDQLQAYLTPRLSQMDGAVLAVTRNQAEVDVATVRSASVLACEQKCGAMPSPDAGTAFKACTLQCAPDAISHLRTCADLGWLPH